MSISVASWLLGLVGIYLGLGALFAVPFVVKGAGRIDPSAAEGTVGFKILIIPGVMAFWPLLASRWLKGAKAPPVEKSPHRNAARVATANERSEVAP